MPPKGKSRKRRSSKNFVAIPFAGSLALVTLADGAALIGDLFNNALGEDLFIISIDGAWAIRGLTATEGPISVGYSHGDLTAAEVVEALDAELTDPDDIIQKERARRPVRYVGRFPGLNTNEVLNNGNRSRTTLKFSVGDTFKPSFFARNQSGGTLTTGAIVEVEGVLYGRWQR